MISLPEALYGAEAVREADRRAMQRPGFGGGELMERAGAVAFRQARERYPRTRRWRVACGPGNNGGDGYVVARLARAAGLDVTTLVVSTRQAGAGEAQVARSRWLESGGEERRLDDQSLDNADLLIDALFGTGVERPLDDVWCNAVQRMNQHQLPIMAIDVPSGLHADSGEVMGAAVHAATTISFIGLKAGLFTGEGRTHAGQILFSDLGVPADVFHGLVPTARRITHNNLSGLLQPRLRHAHKGDAGHVLVVGGQPGMAGAVKLSGEAAYRAGAGLVTVATHPTHAEVAGIACPQLITAGINHPGDLKPLIERAGVVALGPGLGQSAWALGLFQWVIQQGVPLVLDADALNLLARHPHTGTDWILTPHPGEAARLLNCTVPDIQHDRFAAAHEIVARFGGVCVLKGNGTLVASAGGSPPWLCDRGNPVMATGGTGDVLTGIIAALRAQGLPAIDAARLGVWTHATAGDVAARDGERGMMAQDLLAPIRTLLNEPGIG